jgi:mannose-6-phosphate isomerase-like protein (cupin superfamily)
MSRPLPDSADPFAMARLGDAHDVLAPDSSEIRLLLSTGRGSMVHATLPAGGVSLAIVHRTVDELWYILAGQGQMWRKLGELEAVVDVAPGSALTIPRGTHFQFRATGSEPLRVVLCTIPPWPGEQEAQRVLDHWPVALSGAPVW